MIYRWAKQNAEEQNNCSRSGNNFLSESRETSNLFTLVENRCKMRHLSRLLGLYLLLAYSAQMLSVSEVTMWDSKESCFQAILLQIRKWFWIKGRLHSEEGNNGLHVSYTGPQIQQQKFSVQMSLRTESVSRRVDL